jgi:hypothetical protein
MVVRVAGLANVVSSIRPNLTGHLASDVSARWPCDLELRLEGFLDSPGHEPQRRAWCTLDRYPAVGSKLKRVYF